MIGVSVSRLNQFVQADRLPYVRAGRRVWFRREHVEQFVAKRVFEAQAGAISRDLYV